MRIFVLEDDPDRIRWFTERFIGHEWDCVHSCEREYDFKPPYDLICLDHDLGGSQMGMKHGRPLELAEAEDNGATFAKLIVDRVDDALILIHSYNPDGADNIFNVFNDKLGYHRAVKAPFRGPYFNSLLDLLVPVKGKIGV